jgi:hypothetical protein
VRDELSLDFLIERETLSTEVLTLSDADATAELAAWAGAAATAATARAATSRCAWVIEDSGSKGQIMPPLTEMICPVM